MLVSLAEWTFYGITTARKITEEYPSSTPGINVRLPAGGPKDKLRAIQYLVAAVEAGSLTGAARQPDVSVPAVQKLIGALNIPLAPPCSNAMHKASAPPSRAANTWTAADCLWLN